MGKGNPLRHQVDQLEQCTEGGGRYGGGRWEGLQRGEAFMVLPHLKLLSYTTLFWMTYCDLAGITETLMGYGEDVNLSLICPPDFEV